MYQIGDRVRCLVDKPENNGHIVCGSMGTVVYCEGNIVFVEWDNYVDGHDCDGHASEWGYGWNVLSSDKLQDLIFQAIEIEGMESDFLLETLVEENDEYYSSDECVVTPEIVRTSEPSRFIMWENRPPHIFSVDRKRSKLHFNEL